MMKNMSRRATAMRTRHPHATATATSSTGVRMGMERASYPYVARGRRMVWSPRAREAQQLHLTTTTTTTTTTSTAGALPSDVQSALGTFQGSSGSYWASLGLFAMTAPGLYSMVKRAPKASKKQVTFEEPGPAAKGGRELDAVASSIASYFAKYNYKIKGTGEVITFEGVYEANRGQGIALTFYVFLSLASIALVLSIVQPDVGGKWYALILLSPAAYTYYMSNGTRTETVKVKMITSDDDKTTDVIVEADKEEIERMSKELSLLEKGKVYQKGILERTTTTTTTTTP